MKRSEGMRAVLALALAGLLTGGCQDVALEDTRGTEAGASLESSRPAGWLYTEGNRIRLSTGEVWRARGANLHDTRSCNACAYEPPDVNEVKRRVDVLVDGWKASLIRLNLESYASASGRVHWQGVLDDPQYLAHVKEVVDHIGTKPGVYVLLSLWQDPTLNAQGWPTAQTLPVWRKLAETFKDSPHVLFGLCNEPQLNDDGAQDAQVWTAMNDTVAAIRAVEDAAGTPRHIITVQGTRGWGRWLDYYAAHPITAGNGENIAYETHVYDAASAFPQLFQLPARTLPVIIGEFGPEQGMTAQDAGRLMDVAEALDIPYLAWTFHARCGPDLLQEDPSSPSVCDVGSPLVPTSWGQFLQARLAQPWCAGGCTPPDPRIHVYQDGLGTRFEDWSWGTYNLQATGQVHSGTRSIRFEPDYWDGLDFHHPGLNASQYESLELWVHGGTVGGQKVLLTLRDGDDVVFGGIRLDVALGHPIAAGTWQRVSIPFSSLGLSSELVRDIRLEDATGMNQGAMFVDDLVLIPKAQ